MTHRVCHGPIDATSRATTPSPDVPLRKPAELPRIPGTSADPSDPATPLPRSCRQWFPDVVTPHHPGMPGPEVWGGPCPRLTPCLVTRHRGANEGWHEATDCSPSLRRGEAGTGRVDPLPFADALKMCGLLAGPGTCLSVPGKCMEQSSWMGKALSVENVIAPTRDRKDGLPHVHHSCAPVCSFCSSGKYGKHSSLMATLGTPLILSPPHCPRWSQSY